MNMGMQIYEGKISVYGQRRQWTHARQTTHAHRRVCGEHMATRIPEMMMKRCIMGEVYSPDLSFLSI
jgi:hypothetical protein